jgi:pimeloyl-ACP methyl ester carboxylesterase
MASVVAVHEVILIANSEGHLAADVRPLVRFNVSVIVEQDGRREQGYAGAGGRFTLPELVKNDKPLALAREAVRQALHLNQISLLGHSYGGVLAQAYALKYQKNLSHLILASTFGRGTDRDRCRLPMPGQKSPEGCAPLVIQVHRVRDRPEISDSRPFDPGPERALVELEQQRARLPGADSVMLNAVDHQLGLGAAECS